MKLGCNTVLFGGFDLETALRGIAFAGYHAAELSAILGMSEHLRIDLGPEHVHEVKLLASKYGLALTAVEAATNDPERLRRILQVSADVGVRVVNIGPGGKSGDAESLERSIDFVASMSDEAAKLGVTLAVKAHVGAAIYNTETTLQAIRQIDSPGFGVDFDPSHIFRAGEDPEAAVRALAGRLAHVHIRDCVSREQRVGPPPDQVPGRGNVDLVALFRALDAIGFDGPVNLEIIGALKYELWQAQSIAAESQGYLRRCMLDVGIT
jgi:sugar phosphate isomerase/epimerase